MFEKASRLKIRFDTSVGSITTEDLWDVPLTGKGVDLDGIAKQLNRELKEVAEESFVKPRISNENCILQYKFDIVKHIIDVKLEEADSLKQKAAKKAKKEKLLAIIARKEEENLSNESVETLKEMAKNL